MNDDLAQSASYPLTRNLLRRRTMSDLSDSERSILEGAIGETRTYAAGQVLVGASKEIKISTLLVSGLISRHVDSPDGGRHLVGIQVPGDFVDLHAYALKQLDHDVGALTDVEVAIVPHEALEQIQRDHVHLTKRLWFLTLLDAALHRQWTFRIASLNATERVAHFLCEMNARLLAIDHSDGKRFELPMTQSDIGEVCGITNVHVNRVLRELRERGLCSMRASAVEIFDLQALCAFGQFDPQYIYLDQQTAREATGR